MKSSAVIGIIACLLITLYAPMAFAHEAGSGGPKSGSLVHEEAGNHAHEHGHSHESGACHDPDCQFHHHDDADERSTGENAEFGRIDDHDHDHCMSCDEYFNAAWRLPETVTLMKGQSLNFAIVFIILMAARLAVKFAKKNGRAGKKE